MLHLVEAAIAVLPAHGQDRGREQQEAVESEEGKAAGPSRKGAQQQPWKVWSSRGQARHDKERFVSSCGTSTVSSSCSPLP